VFQPADLVQASVRDGGEVDEQQVDVYGQPEHSEHDDDQRQHAAHLPLPLSVAAPDSRHRAMR